MTHLAKNNEKPKIEMNWEKKNYLGDTSGMSKTMTSNVISKNKMFSRRWNSSTVLINSHVDVFYYSIYRKMRVL